MKKGSLFVVSAPSGCGKGTILGEVFKENNAYYSVSCTTRSPREGEKDGVHYHFITKETFKDLISDDGFLEYAQYSDNFYGTPKAPVVEKLSQGIDVILEIEPQGAFQVKKSCDFANLIFILPPSVGELKRRLNKRGTEKQEVIQKRVDAAAKEIEASVDYDFVIMNDDLDPAIADFKSIIEYVKSGNAKENSKFSPKNENIKQMIKGVLENA